MMPPYDPNQDPNALTPVNNAFTATGNPADAEQSFGGQKSFSSAALAQSGAAATAEDSAMQYLRQAMNKSQDISPSQGFAAALLAAIPTLGGALISRANPTPKLPAGVYYKDPNDLLAATANTGDAVAAAGAIQGGKLASGYINSVNPDNTALLEKMSALQAARGQQLQGSADSLTQAGLTQGAEDARSPLVNADARANQIDINNQEGQNQLGRSEALAKYTNDLPDKSLPTNLSPEAQTALNNVENKQPVDFSTIKDPKELKFVQNQILLGNQAQNAGTRADSASHKGDLSDATILKIGAPASVAADLGARADQFQKAIGDDSSILGKDFSQLVPGTAAYNAALELHVDALRANKILDGRVTETTLKAYSALTDSFETESLGQTLARIKDFQGLLQNDSKFQASILKAGGKNTAGLDTFLNGGSSSSGGGSSSSAPTISASDFLANLRNGGQ